MCYLCWHSLYPVCSKRELVCYHCMAVLYGWWDLIYYACNCTVALSPGISPSFEVLKLGIEPDTIQTTFFFYLVWCLLDKECIFCIGSHLGIRIITGQISTMNVWLRCLEGGVSNSSKKTSWISLYVFIILYCCIFIALKLPWATVYMQACGTVSYAPCPFWVSIQYLLWWDPPECCVSIWEAATWC